MAVRDWFWEYPALIMRLINRFPGVFVATAGIVSALVLYSVVGNLLSWKLERKIFTETFRYGVIGQLVSVNPLDVRTDEANQALAKLLFNSLVSTDESGRLNPELAETWAISPDGRVYTFFLRKGVRWHDGQEVTAADVKSTYELLASGDQETSLSALASDVDVEVRNLYEVAFKLKQVNASFLELATIPILPEHVYGDLTYSRISELGDTIQPVGSGPYKYLKRFKDVLYLQANEQYFKGTPKIQSFELTLLPSYENAEKGLLNGEFHLISPLTSSQAQAFSQIAGISSRLKIKATVQANNTRVLLFNVNKETTSIWKDINLRQAIGHGIERATVAQLFPGSTVAFGPYDKSSYAYSSTVEGLLSHSFSESNQLLEKSGWEYPYSGASYRTKGDQELRLTVTFLGSASSRLVAEKLREQLLQAGVNVVLREVSAEEFTQQVLPGKDFEALLFEVQTGVDPDQYGLWHSSQSEFPALNLAGYNSPQIDSYLEKGRLQTNIDKRIEIYRAFQTDLVKDAVAIFLYHPAFYEAYFDIINRDAQDSLLTGGDRFSNVQQWTLEPGWRNWQTR